MRLSTIWAILLVWLVAACARDMGFDDGDGSEQVGSVSSAVVTMSTDATTYPKAGTVHVSFSGGPGAPRDWIGIAPVGAPDGQFIAYKYVSLVGGVTSGGAAFDLPASAAGEYEARLFYNDSYTRLGTSNTFHVGPLITTDRGSYAPSDTIGVSYSWVLPGNGLDWVAIAPVGGSAQSYVRWAYTGGNTNGAQSFPVGGALPIPPGTYEARLYGYFDVLQATSAPFTIIGPSITTDKSVYLAAETMSVSYDGAVGSGTDWVALIPEGAPDASYVRWAYTNQSSSGTLTFSLAGLPAGSYVVKLFANDNLTLQATSALASVADNVAEITVDKAAYLAHETAHVTFTNTTPTARDWVAIAPAGSPGAGYLRWQYTGGTSGGALDFPIAGLPSGSYVARLYANDVLDLRATSAEFSVSAAAHDVTTDKTTYLRTETAQVRFTAVPATSFDWVSITPVGAPETSYVRWAYTNGASTGTLGFALADLAPGDYVARLYANNILDLRATSPVFSVTAAMGVSTTKTHYTGGEPVVVTFAGLPGNGRDWIAIAPVGAPGMGYVAWAYSNGQQHGTRSFAVAPGRYVARLHLDNGYAIAAESAPFDVVAKLEIATASLPYAILNGSYNRQLTATGGVAPRTWSLAPGSSMPAGLALSASGAISGSPTTEGSQSFTVRVTDAASQEAERTMSLEVRSIAPKPALTSISPDSAMLLAEPVTLTVIGTNFLPRSVVYWGSNNPLPTTYVSSTELTATISTELLGLAGPHPITVYTSLPGGGTSAPRTFTVVVP